MKSYLKEYFTFSSQERRGIVVLLVLIAIVFSTPKLIERFKSDEQFDFSAFSSTIEKLNKEPEVKENKPVKPDAINYFSFNPNTVSYKELLLLGLSKKQAQTFINYRKSGAFFSQPSDIKKVYSISDDLYKKLKPFIKIPEKDSDNSGDLLTDSKDNKVKEVIKKPKPEEIPLVINLNQADSIDLIKLPGIGPAYARRIINYRNFLGGYYNLSQLKEVYGISDELFNKISTKVQVDSAQIIQIDLNATDFSTLNKHPYIDYKHTKAILKYRKLMGSFKSTDEIRKNNLMDAESFKKVEAYLTISQTN